MVVGRFGLQASLALEKQLGLCMGEEGSDGMLLNRPTLNVLSLEHLGLPRWWLRVSWSGWLEMWWLERTRERVPSEIKILPGQSGMVYEIVSLFFLLFFFEDSIKPFLVWAIICVVVIILFVEDAIPLSFSWWPRPLP
jgi:hypothetical protein